MPRPDEPLTRIGDALPHLDPGLGVIGSSRKDSVQVRHLLHSHPFCRLLYWQPSFIIHVRPQLLISDPLTMPKEQGEVFPELHRVIPVSSGSL